MGFNTPKPFRKVIGGAFQNLEHIGLTKKVTGGELGAIAGDIKKNRKKPKSQTGTILTGFLGEDSRSSELTE